VRKGRLVGQEPFFFDKVAGWSDGEILSAFVRQFYGKSVAPAPEVLLSEELPETELTAEWLSTLAERRVQVVAPQRGAKRQFVAMAEANAAIALQNRLLSRDDRSSSSSRSSSAPSACLACPTGSRATTSRTSRGPSRWARWSSGKTAG